MQPGDWFYLPQRGQLSALYLPDEIHLPPDADLRAIGFSFPDVAGLGTAYQVIQVKPAFNCWAIVATDTLAGAQGFQVQIWHLSPGGQRQLFNTNLSSLIVGGHASNPMFLRETELFLNGDSIRVQVKNLDPANTDTIWVALWGGDVQVSQ